MLSSLSPSRAFMRRQSPRLILLLCIRVSCKRTTYAIPRSSQEVQSRDCSCRLISNQKKLLFFSLLMFLFARKRYVQTPNGHCFVKSSVRKGLLPEILDGLLSQRAKAKVFWGKIFQIGCFDDLSFCY